MKNSEILPEISTFTGKKIPLSPYNLLQEIYIHDPWKIMTCCIFLNQTKRKQVDKIRESFFRKWSTPESLLRANSEEICELIRPLGFYNRRTKTLLKFSQDWIAGGWNSPKELTGIGQYALDSWKIFVEGEVVENPSDHVLNDYINWRRTIC